MNISKIEHDSLVFVFGNMWSIDPMMSEKFINRWGDMITAFIENHAERGAARF